VLRLRGSLDTTPVSAVQEDTSERGLFAVPSQFAASFRPVSPSFVHMLLQQVPVQLSIDSDPVVACGSNRTCYESNALIDLWLYDATSLESSVLLHQARWHMVLPGVPPRFLCLADIPVG
jgi:hypothetical protein